ncbi:MAG: matrixin family metalloprotease [Candidatus Melainabacteria bacterium]
MVGLVVLTVISIQAVVFADNATIVAKMKAARLAMHAGENKQAVNLYTPAAAMARTERDPNLPVILYNLALAHQNSEAFDLASQAYQELLSLPGVSMELLSKAQLNLAVIQIKHARFDDAVASMQKLIDYGETSQDNGETYLGDAYVVLSNAYRAQHKLDESAQALKKAIPLLEANPQSLYAENLPRLKQSLGLMAYVGAREVVNRATDEPTTPGSGDIASMIKKAELAFEREDLETAEQLLNEVLMTARPEDKLRVNATSLRGHIHFANLQLDAAESDYLSALSLAKELYGPDFDVALVLPDTTLFLAKTYLFKGRFIEARQFAQQARSSLETIHAQELVENAEKLLKEIQDASGEGTYTHKNGDVVRWNDNTHEIWVAMVPGTQLEGWHDSYLALAQQAFDEWSHKINQRLTFRFVPASGPYDVKFSWVQNPLTERVSDESVPVGINVMGTWNHMIRYSDIQISLKNQSGRLFKEEALYSTMLHEIGHMIGLKEHSDNPADIMYPHATGTGISERDIVTFNELYRKEPTITNPSGGHLSQLSASIALVEQGREYINKKQYRKAYKYLLSVRKEEGISFEELNFLLGVAAFGSEKFEEAIEYFEKTQTHYDTQRYPRKYMGVSHVALGHQYSARWGKKNREQARQHYSTGVRQLRQFISDPNVNVKEKVGLDRYITEGQYQKPTQRVQVIRSYTPYNSGRFY